MSKPVPLDEFLSAQSAGFTATIEAIPDKPKYVKVTPFRDGGGCGCSASVELPREAVRSVTGTGKFHFCCGKRLEIAIVEFAKDASVPVADLLKPKEPAHDHEHDHAHGHDHRHQHGPEGGWHHGPRGHREHMGGPEGYAAYGEHSPYGAPAFGRSGFGDGPPPPPRGPDGRPTALIGRWRIPWSRCSVSCIEVCTRTCGPTGWDCCAWETRCAVNCDGPYWDPLPTLF